MMPAFHSLRKSEFFWPESVKYDPAVNIIQVLGVVVCTKDGYLVAVFFSILHQSVFVLNLFYCLMNFLGE